MKTQKTATEPQTPEAKPTPLSFKEKMFRVMDSIHILEKDGFNSNQKYKFTSEKTIKLRLREALIENRLLINFSIGSIAHELCGEKMKLTTITGAITINDVDSDNSITIPFAGTGTDMGDKGLYKAITGMIKYGLTSTFLVPTGDDPEGDEKARKEKTPQILSETHQKKIDECHNIEDLKDYYSENQGLGEVFNAYVTKRKLELTHPTHEDS